MTHDLSLIVNVIGMASFTCSAAAYLMTDIIKLVLTAGLKHGLIADLGAGARGSGKTEALVQHHRAMEAFCAAGAGS